MTERPKLTAEDVAIINKIKSYPGCEKLKWRPCRICLEMCPSNLGDWGNRHATCLDPEPTAPKRRDLKTPNPDQGQLL